MLIDQQQAIELAGTQPGDSRGHQIPRVRVNALTMRIMRSFRIVQCNTHPAKHAVLPSRVTLQFMLSREV
jgi:hypothetical protein